MFKLQQLMVSATLILAGCVSLAPDYAPPELPVPRYFSRAHNALVAPADGYRDTGWRTYFADPQLRRLIDEALRHNRDLQMAALKVQEAQAQYRVTDADRYPQLGATANASWNGGFKGNSASSKTFDVGLGLSFDFDLFGRLKNMSEADRQNFFASESARRAVHILLIANLSQSYFNQRLAREQLAIAHQTLDNYRLAYAFVERQLVTGSANVLALEQARGVIDSTRAEIARREGQLAQANSALQLLLGSYPALPQAVPGEEPDLNPVVLPPNLSASILLQRPDIQEAEHQLRAANANIGAARAAFFPSITLTSGASTSSTSLTDLFSASSGLWNFMPKIELPIFNAGRNRANLTLAEVRAQQSVVNYEQKIQTAFKQVADTLSQRTSLSDQIAAQRRYLASLDVTVQRASALYASGAVSYIDVLDAERQRFATRQALLDLQYARQANEITLFTALGGGWVE